MKKTEVTIRRWNTDNEVVKGYGFDVTFPSGYAVSCVAHRLGSDWSITCPKTGRHLSARPAPTRRDAVANVVERIEWFGEERVKFTLRG